MISAVNISLQFGGRHLFKEISFRIGSHDRIGLVGSNGAGKSTLLKILVGEALQDNGIIEKAKYVTVGYLPQDGIHTRGNTLYHEVESVFGNILELQSNLEAIHTRMSQVPHDSDEFKELLEIYGELQHKLEDSEAFRLKAKIEKILMGLGFSQTDMTRQTEEFSGGWQMRIALAKLLLIQPTLLLLDEPTNHLDLDSLQWLEAYLQYYEGAVVLVSHDRRFLDTITTKTFEVSLGMLTEYAGNFTFYVKAKEERKQLQLAAFKNQQRQIKQTERFIGRFRYKASKASQVQSRIKQLEKIDLIEIEEEESGIHFQFPTAPHSGKVVMELHDVHKKYGDLQIFSGIDFEIDRGDRIAFVGVNGAGKSTLSRIIAGTEPIDSGHRITGHSVFISYFAQHQAEELNPQHEVLETVDEIATGEIRKKLRTLLGCFLFSGDDVFKKVAVLSGGEKSRLALAKMLLQPSNLIIMDEPTNHLDMRSKGILQEALGNFQGSYVIVSHDRDFLDPIINKVVEFKSGNIRIYPGNISEYLYRKENERSSQQGQTIAPRLIPSVNEKERKRREAEQRQKMYKKTKPIMEEIEKTEKSIEGKEKEKTEIEQLMADPASYQDGDAIREMTERYKALQEELTSEYFKWNRLTQELEKVQNTHFS